MNRGMFGRKPRSSQWTVIDEIEIPGNRVVARPLVFRGISQDYTHLQIICSLRSAAAATTGLCSVQFNGDGAGSYSRDYIQMFASAAAAVNSTGQTSAVIGSQAAASAAAGLVGQSIITIPNYSSSVMRKYFTFSGGTDVITQTGQGIWLNTTAIHQIQFADTTAGSTLFDGPSRATLLAI